MPDATPQFDLDAILEEARAAHAGPDASGEPRYGAGWTDIFNNPALKEVLRASLLIALQKLMEQLGGNAPRFGGAPEAKPEA